MGSWQQVIMNVDSLLNRSAGEAGELEQKRRNSAASSTPSATGDTTAASTAVHTPSPGRGSPSRRRSGSQSPARNRRPWDAGGYTLPLTIDTKSIPSLPVTRSTYGLDSPTDGHTSVSPNSPGHKYSHSRSSLSSSYTSSTTTNSGSHSRISSLSTVGEFQPLSNLMTDISLDSNNNKYHSYTNKKKMAERADIPPASGDGEVPRRQTRAQRLQSEAIDLTVDERPESPSDAVMIRRGQTGRSNSSSPILIDESPPRDARDPRDNARNEAHNDSRDNSPSGIHRRTTSAPDTTPGDSTTANQRAPAFAPAQFPPLAPPAGHAAAGNAPYTFGLDPALINSAVPRLFSTLDELAQEIDFTAPKTCKYMDNCTLTRPDDPEGNWRKAMSHVFGRNKNCTRDIPTGVWIMLCRKHYQRARYRNNLEYNKRLCGLVETQVLRVEAWSNQNRINGTPENGTVRDWTLVPRRREQMRLEEAKETKSKKRAHDDDSENDEDIAVGSTVPRWLLNLCRPGYSAVEIQRIIARISGEMDRGNLNQVPDIEILPNIIGENLKAKGKAARAKSKAPSTHRRAQSMGNASQTQQGGLMLDSSRRVSQPTSYLAPRGNSCRQDEDVRPTSKRRRFSEAEDEDDYEEDTVNTRFPTRTLGRTVPNVRPRPHGGRFLDQRAGPHMQQQYDYGANSGSSHLPAPRGQYSSEANSSRGMGLGYDEFRGRAPTHQRAYSDAAGTVWGPQLASNMPFSSAGPSGFNNEPQNGYSNYYPHGAPASSGYNSFARGEYRQDDNSYPAQGGYYQQQPVYHQQPLSYYGPPSGGVKHMRHQSTPGASRPIPQQQMMGPPPLPPQAAPSMSTSDPYGPPYPPTSGAIQGRQQSYSSLAAVPAAPRENVARVAEPSEGSADAPTAPAGELEAYPSAVGQR